MQKKKLRILRVQDWWGHILPPILLFYYAGATGFQNGTSTLIFPMLLLVFTSVITAITGYFINDLFDIKSDLAAGKKNYVSGLPRMVKLLFLPVIVLLFFAVLIIMSSHISTGSLKSYVLVFSFNLMLFFFYSSPPVRLKKHIYFAPVADALYSGTLFYMLAYTQAAEVAANSFPVDRGKLIMTGALIFGWGFIKGIRNYFTHLCDDSENDKRSRINTLATVYGNKKLQTFANLFFPLEILLFAVFASILPETNISAIIICLVFLFSWYRIFFSRPSEKHVFLNDLHEVWLPLIFLIQLAFYTKLYLIIIIHFIFFPYHLYKIYCVLDRLYFHTVFRWLGPIRKQK
jgi:4-hydroxybenzoate polyprenyltransferase